LPDTVKNLLPRLRNPDFTKVLLISLPEATPVHEAIQLQCDLQRAEIQPYAWVINQSLTPLAVTDPGLQSRRDHERTYINEVTQKHAIRTVIIPWHVKPPCGREALNRLTETENVSTYGGCRKRTRRSTRLLQTGIWHLGVAPILAG
jgi:arsenite-transporting ATPase